jgi:uncharacterized protein YraI
MLLLDAFERPAVDTIGVGAMVSPIATSAALIGMVSIAASLVAAPDAAAETQTVTVNTGALDLNVRSAPSANSQKIGVIPNHARVVITCFARGATFTGGPYGVTTNIWNRLDSGGFVTDAMLDTGSDDPVVPPCGVETPSPVAPARLSGKKTLKNTARPGTDTWAAFAKWFQVSGERFYPALSGVPKDLANAARATGWTVVEDPQPRSIVVFQPGVLGARPEGHVAWVDSTAKLPEGQYITITEMQADGDDFNKWTSRTVKDEPGMSYILLP